jgi:hypothetical protein
MPILCLDFDGVLHSYTSGWLGADVIPDPPVPGYAQFLLRAVEVFEVHTFGSRSRERGGIEAMREWLSRDSPIDRATIDHLLERIHFPDHKPAAFLSLDDRALTFRGAWPDIAELAAFKTWQKG